MFGLSRREYILDCEINPVERRKMKSTPSPINIVSHDKLEIRQGGGCISWFGLPFLGAGIFMLLNVAQIIPFSNAREIPLYAWFILAGMGIIFGCVGAAMVFGRSWIIIDRTQRKIWHAKGLLRPMRGKAYELADYSSVQLSMEKGDSDTSDTYKISLQNSKVGSELGLWSSTCYGEARKHAEKLMQFLKLPLIDVCTGQKEVLKADSLLDGKHSIQYIKPAVTIIPQKLRSDISQNGSILQIRILGRKFGISGFIELAIPLIIFMVFGTRVIPFFRSTNTPLMVSSIFVGFVGTFFVLLPLIGVIRHYIRSVTINTIVRMDAKGIFIEVLSGINRGNYSIARNSIVGLDYSLSEIEQPVLSDGFSRRGTADSSQYSQITPPHWILKIAKKSATKGIIIKSREGLFHFGEGLDFDEVKYIYSTMVNHIGEFWVD